MLRIYIAEHCPSYATAHLRLAQLSARCPGVPTQLVDIDVPGARVPSQIIGTPMYTWDDRIIFRGNPGEEELIARIATLRGVAHGPGADQAGLSLRG